MKNKLLDEQDLDLTLDFVDDEDNKKEVKMLLKNYFLELFLMWCS